MNSVRMRDVMVMVVVAEWKQLVNNHYAPYLGSRPIDTCEHLDRILSSVHGSRCPLICELCKSRFVIVVNVHVNVTVVVAWLVLFKITAEMNT